MLNSNLFHDGDSSDEHYLIPTDNFQKEVEEIVESKSETELNLEDKYQKLKKIFQKYGYVYPRYVILGGKLFYTDTQEVNKGVIEDEHKSKIHAALTAELSSFIQVKGSVGGGKQTSNLQTTENTTHKSSIIWEAIGGDTLQNNNASAWTTSVGNSQHWQVIEYGDFIPTYKLLNEKLQKQIENILRGELINMFNNT